jgi:inhibitor of KinA sporulation pathway (predicted exonuclease)
MIPGKKYFALDLELNNAEDNSTPNPPIIQVGIAIGSYVDYVEGTIYKQKWYIDPGEPIFPFITNLTGITDDDIKNYSISHAGVAAELSDLIQAEQPFVNPITWGGADTVELKNEFKQRDISFPYFGHRWIDVKTWYTLHFLAKGKNPSGSLRSAMGYYKLQFIGTPHRADDDAYNTLRVFFHILERQSKINDVLSLAKEL